MNDSFHQEGILLVETMARALVDDVSAVTVAVMQGENTTVFNLTVARSDIGKVIGRQGKNAAMLRQLLSAWSAKHKRRSVLEILE